ncbi:MAG: hypothetical protein R3E79_19340 [Caldilineaceae bacterium]
MTGQFVTDDVTTPAYWVRQALAAVRFAAGVATVAGQGWTPGSSRACRHC